MTDVHTPEQRSRNMAAIRSRDTKPEMVVRKIVHRLGFRFRLHRRDLPGKPDLVLPKHRKVIFVHGCYWHIHNCKYGRVVPKTNSEFWRKKRESNVTRDKQHLRVLKKSGWIPLVVWECETKDVVTLTNKLKTFLNSNSGNKFNK